MKRIYIIPQSTIYSVETQAAIMAGSSAPTPSLRIGGKTSDIGEEIKVI